VKIKEILPRGSMGMKTLSISSNPTSDAVSADSLSVGLAGYLRSAEGDTIRLDIRPPRPGHGQEE
jgi:hypothetical protein